MTDAMLAEMHKLASDDDNYYIFKKAAASLALNYPNQYQTRILRAIEERHLGRTYIRVLWVVCRLLGHPAEAELYEMTQDYED